MTDLKSGLAAGASIDRGQLEADIVERRRRLAELMERSGFEALVVASEANAFYLTGYETTFFGNKSKPFCVILAPPHDPVVVCHVGEVTSVELDAIATKVHPYVGPDVLTPDGHVQIDYQQPAADAVADVLADLGVGSIGLEMTWHFMPGFTPHAMDRLRERFQGEVMDASGVIWGARRIKSEWEIGQMKLAAQVADRAHQTFVETASVGMTERELNRLIRLASYQHGAEKIGYSGLIAGIDRAPLGGPSDRVWEKGQMLFVDICLQLGGGYFADFNRVYASSTPTGRQVEAYAEVVDGLERGRGLLRAGLSISELASTMIGDADTIYARVGHGLGLEMPEPPSLSPQDESTLSAGEVICIEPNLHAPGVGWLVSEEEVVIREDGYELISPSFPTELEIIG